MVLAATEHKYVELDKQNVPYITGTTMKGFQYAEKLRKEAGESPLVKKLRAKALDFQ